VDFEICLEADANPSVERCLRSCADLDSLRKSTKETRVLNFLTPLRANRRLAIALCSLILPLLLLPACGSGTHSSASTRPALTKAQLISIANPICLRGDRKINRTMKSAFASGGFSPGRLARYARETGMPILRRMITELRALNTAPGQFQVMLTTAEGELAELEKQPSHFGDKAFAKADRLAHEYGLPDC
jgi:hypothetical protein